MLIIGNIILFVNGASPTTNLFAQPPFIQRAYRYGYDYCPQLAALGRPEVRPVIPE